MSKLQKKTEKGGNLRRTSKSSGDDGVKNLVETGRKKIKNKKRSDRYSIRQKHRELQPDVRGKKDLPRGK